MLGGVDQGCSAGQRIYANASSAQERVHPGIKGAQCSRLPSQIGHDRWTQIAHTRTHTDTLKRTYTCTARTHLPSSQAFCLGALHIGSQRACYDSACAIVRAAWTVLFTLITLLAWKGNEGVNNHQTACMRGTGDHAQGRGLRMG
eukprot:1159069-Pelagomonas_calceolata.AAC.9